MLVPSDEWGTLQEKLEFSSTFDEYVSVDVEALTCHLSTIEGLYKSTEPSEQESEDYDKEEDTEVKVTNSQAYEFLDILRNFVASQSNVPEHVIQSIFHLDYLLLMQATKRQTTINDFFRK
ncbi:hypothetical protein PR048_012967 [Dryococelus australis]|uniref:Uncharacterized protein n=1 Tax=Dryococelus australis TaxID=614101 RepID=A0ABQ9HQV2_9NEOP|nr:hypothetical protein PR048_012967 [Dryococelus australis]